MHLTTADINAWVGSYMWPFFRIAALLTAMPLFGSPLAPFRIRLAMAVLVSLVIAPTVTAVPTVEIFSAASLVIIVQQVLIGVAMGFALHLVYSVFVLAGQIIAMQMGLGFAAMVDPQSGSHVPIVSQFYTLLVSLTFLALNGHLVVIEFLADSFRIVPIGVSGLGTDGLWTLVSWGSQMFGGAVVIALPAIAALLLANVSFGVMTRAAPQLNIFAVGFPITLVLGFVIMLVLMPNVIEQISSQMELGIGLMHQLLPQEP